ncbi:MAG: enoyl-CoA hydratase/isomerase family protein [Acidobacteriota bacterium]
MIDIHDEGAVRTLTLQHPPANALDPALLAGLRSSLETSFEEGAGPRALVLAGAPGMFSGGLDVPSLLPLDRSALATAFDDFWAIQELLATSPIPVVAAITGHSPAGGCVLATACDERIMARGRFKIGLNEVRVGLPLPPMIFEALQHLVGPVQALRWGAEGYMGNPEEALAAGLVDELVEPEAVVPRAQERCREKLALPAEAFSRTRRLARAAIADIYRQGEASSRQELLDGWFSAEAQENLHALVQRLNKPKKK